MEKFFCQMDSWPKKCTNTNDKQLLNISQILLKTFSSIITGQDTCMGKQEVANWTRWKADSQKIRLISSSKWWKSRTNFGVEVQKSYRSIMIEVFYIPKTSIHVNIINDVLAVSGFRYVRIHHEDVPSHTSKLVEQICSQWRFHCCHTNRTLQIWPHTFLNLKCS